MDCWFISWQIRLIVPDLYFEFELKGVLEISDSNSDDSELMMGVHDMWHGPTTESTVVLPASFQLAKMGWKLAKGSRSF